MRPNFIVIGALKAGTTALWEYLRHHPDVFMPDAKELDFFVAGRNWERGLDWYEGCFRDARSGARAVGEASPYYTMAPAFPGVPERMAGVVPDARLVYVLRDPIERIKSHYLHRLARRPQPPIDRLIMEDLELLHTSRYAYQLELFLERYPRERVLLITSEDLRNRRAETVARVFAFLGVDPAFVPPTIGVETNPSTARRVPAAPVARLRDTPVRAVARLAPRSVKRWVGRTTARRHHVSEVTIAPAVEARLREALREDVARLRPYMDPGFDGWGLG